MLSQQILKRYYKTLGTILINSLLSPLSLSVCYDNIDHRTLDVNGQFLVTPSAATSSESLIS